MIRRDEYLNELIKWKNEKVIKVITGIRRCGKSTILMQYRDYLISSGVNSGNIIYINFEDLEYENLLDYREMYKYITDRMKPDSMNYILLDEVQKADGFQKSVDSLQLKDNADITITGSNAYLLSGELATYLSGRYVEIKVLPLSFAEFCEIRGSDDYDRLFGDYMRFGSMPYVASLDSIEKADASLEGIYNTIIVKDIELRQVRREPDADKRKVTDIVLLKNIARFLASSIGNPVSIKSITDYITSAGRKVSANTVGDYTRALVEPYIFYTAERYDINGKQLLKTNNKYYIADVGLRRFLLPRKNYDLGFTLENIVYLELLRRGYRVSVGKIGDYEIDFVTQKGEKTAYFQVTASLLDEKTFEREMRPLRELKDNYEKNIITLDKFTPGDYDGINVINAVDWLRGC